MINGDKRT